MGHNLPAQTLQMPVVLVFGESFGVLDYSVRTRNMFSAASMTSWTSDSVISCQPSMGLNRFPTPFSVTVQRLMGTSKSTLSFDVPIIVIVAHRENIFSVKIAAKPNFPTSGQSPLTVRGANFGRSDSSAIVRMGGSSSSATQWQDDSQLICRTPPGAGSEAALVATVGFAYGGTRSSSWSYDRASLTSFEKSNLPIAGGVGDGEEMEALIVVRGANFGKSVFSPESRVGGSSCVTTFWMSDTQIIAKNVEGIGRGKFVATVAALLGTSGALLSFDLLHVERIETSDLRVAYNLRSSPDRWLLLSGGGFGSADFTFATRIGTSAESTIWKSDTEMYSRHASGTHHGLALIITMPTTPVTKVALLSFDLPHITAVFTSNAPAKGGTEIMFFGSAFGFADFTAAARLGHTACMFSEWLSQTSLACKVPPGKAVESASLTLTLHALSTGIHASPRTTFTYNVAPVAYSIHPNFSPSIGGAVLTVSGLLMSLSASMELQLWRKGADGAIQLFMKICYSGHDVDPKCKHGIVGETRQGELSNISFILPPGAGENLMVVYHDQSTGLPFFESWQPSFSYSAPAIYSLTSNGRTTPVTRVESGGGGRGSLRLTTPILFAATGGIRDITIRGCSFGGPTGDVHNVRVAIGTDGGRGGGLGGGDMIVAATVAKGDLGHSSMLFRVPDVDLTLFDAGALLLQSVRVVLDERASEAVTRAVSFVPRSLPFKLVLDTDYDSIHVSLEATASFTLTFQIIVMSVVLAPPAVGGAVAVGGSGAAPSATPVAAPVIGLAEAQQVLIANMSRGSTQVEFRVLGSVDGSWTGAATAHQLLFRAWLSGTLTNALSPLGNLSSFEAQGYVVTSTTTTPIPTTPSKNTTPTLTTTPVLVVTTTPPPSKSFLEANAVPLIGAGAGVGVLMLFSGLIVLIRRSLQSDEDLIKNAFSAMTVQTSGMLVTLLYYSTTNVICRNCHNSILSHDAHTRERYPLTTREGPTNLCDRILHMCRFGANNCRRSYLAGCLSSDVSLHCLPQMSELSRLPSNILRSWPRVSRWCVRVDVCVCVHACA